MIRRIVPVVAMAALLGACSHNTNTAEPGTVYPSRSSQDRGPGGRGGREEMAMRGITLSSDQQARIERIRANYRTQMEQARQSAGDDRAAMRERMRPMMEREQAEIREVLTPEQREQYDRNIAEMRTRMQQGDHRPSR